MPHQPLRPAPPPPPPQRNISKSNANHLALLQGLTNDNNNNQQKATSIAKPYGHAAPVRPQKKVPPPRPAPPKRIPASCKETKSNASSVSKKKGSHSNGVRNGLGKYFNLRTGRAINERAPSVRHTKRRAPLPPRSGTSHQTASGVSRTGDMTDSLIDFNSPPPTPAQRSLASKELSLLDLDFDDKCSIGESTSLLDIDFFQPDSRSLSSVSSSGSNQFGIFTCSGQPSAPTGNSIDDLLTGPSSLSTNSAWTQPQAQWCLTQKTVHQSSMQNSSSAKSSSSFYVESSGSGDMSQKQFKKPTIIRPSSNDTRRGSGNKTVQVKEPQPQHVMPSDSWLCSSFQQSITINSSGESTSPSPSTERFESPISEASDDAELTYSPPEPQFPPPVLPPSDSVDGLSDTSDGEQWCRALFDFKGENDDELTFSEGDYIRIEDFINLDWMMGSLRGRVGMVPLTFVELVQGPPPDSESANSKSATSSFKVTAMYTFDSPIPGDLNFKEGDVIEVTRTINQDWWYGRLNGKEGQFPCNFVSKDYSTVPKSQQHSPHQVYRALYTFTGEVQGDLSFFEGDKIVVTEIINADWWRGKLVNDPLGIEGIFPCAFVEPFS